MLLPLLISTATFFGLPEIRRFEVECPIAANEIKRLEYRGNQGLWLWNQKGKAHVICNFSSPQDIGLCQPYLIMILEAQSRGRKLILSYPENYDCRHSFGNRDAFVPVIMVAIE